MYQPSPFHTVNAMAQARMSDGSDRNGTAESVRPSAVSAVLIGPCWLNRFCQIRPTATTDATTGA